MLEQLNNGGKNSHSNWSEEQWREYEQRRADSVNRTPGNLNEKDGYECPICLNRGYIRMVDEKGHAYSMECECMPARRNIARIKKSGMGDMLKRYTFENWETPEQWEVEAKQRAIDYTADKEGWFLAYGHTGTGKTHLCTAICGRLMQDGLEAQYVSWREFSTRAKAVVNDQTAYDNLLSSVKAVDVLYIDDLFKAGKGQEPTVADVNLAFEILNFRYNDSTKLTIISTEKSIKELLEIDEAVGSRIYERSKGHGFSFEGKQNWRLRN